MAANYGAQIQAALNSPNFIVQTSKQIASDYGITAAMRLWDDVNVTLYARGYGRAMNGLADNLGGGVPSLFHAIGVKHVEILNASRALQGDNFRRWNGNHDLATYPLDDGFVDMTQYDLDMRKLDNWIARIGTSHGINPTIMKSALISKMIHRLAAAGNNNLAVDNGARLFGVNLIPLMGTNTAPGVGTMTYGSMRGIKKKRSKKSSKGGRRKKKRYY